MAEDLLDARQTRHHDVYMRTTLTIDDDIAQELRELMHRRRATFKDTVNHVLRRGLRAQQRLTGAGTSYGAELFSSSFRPGVDPLRLNQLSDEIEAVQEAGDGEDRP